MDVDDVLVFLGRVLGKLDGAVGPPVEPLGMLRDPGMVRRALDGEIERDLQAVLARRRNQPLEIVERAELRVDGVVAALRGADGVGAAGIAGPGRQALLRPLRFVRPIGWIGVR